MKREFKKFGYIVPTTERIEIRVERGFAASDSETDGKGGLPWLGENEYEED